MIKRVYVFISFPHHGETRGGYHHILNVTDYDNILNTRSVF